MIHLRKQRSLGLALGLIVSAVFLESCAPQGASNNWTRLDAGDFPARVQSITFPGGGVINSAAGRRWGQWDVSFGSDPPVAKWSGSGDDKEIDIEGLRCFNEIEGQKSCLMWLFYGNAGGKYGWGSYCHLTILADVGIDCPTEIKFR